MDIVNLLQNVAYPVAMSIILLYFLKNEKDDRRKDTEGFIKSIDNNTRAVERLVDMFERTTHTDLKREEIFVDDER